MAVPVDLCISHDQRTVVSNFQQQCQADEYDDIKAGVFGKDAIPQVQHVLHWELAAKEQSEPSTIIMRKRVLSVFMQTGHRKSQRGTYYLHSEQLGLDLQAPQVQEQFVVNSLQEIEDLLRPFNNRGLLAGWFRRFWFPKELCLSHVVGL